MKGCKPWKALQISEMFFKNISKAFPNEKIVTIEDTTFHNTLENCFKQSDQSQKFSMQEF